MTMRMASFNLFRLRPLAELLPEVESPTEVVPFRRKAAYTAGSLLVVLAGTQLPLYGIDTSTAVHAPLYWFQTACAANCGTVMALGVIPLLLSEATSHLLLGLRIVNPIHENHLLLNGLQKVLGVLISVVVPVGNALSMGHWSVGASILISLQVFVGSVIVIYLDEVLRKGYGLLPGIPLCTTANVCATLLWRGFRDGKHGDLAASLGFFLLVCRLQGLHVALPLTRPRRSPDDVDAARFQANYSIDISYLSYAPILFQAILLSWAYVFSEQLYMKYGGDKLVNLLGKWERSKTFGGFTPVSGIAYYLTTPPTLADVARDPVHTCLYAALLLGGCAYVSTAWFVLCGYSKRYVARLVGHGVSVTPAQADSIPFSRWSGRVAMVAFVVGLCVGALTLLAGFMRVTGSGTGIMLAVTGIYSFCFNARASSGIGAIGF
ncbi:Protein transport protein Sec61 subunit alpha [Hordeum vulgare]|uniref:Translocon Sec61/SecY plug domain-containing protein n=1 Tax=Hordeum vulgare subsp. vulgare TaxID=112509 RepID=A0A8I6YI07_HORVV|nr:protein transport protein Sec61 subunit alpha-like [Hordeum vulgare subsp. vulgare]KAE8785133.1 Protein transport protein Sec61 subunit alpha [Hordeum vulgare]